MDSFSIIQQYFTQMNCQFCSNAFAENDVELIRQDDAMYIVNVFCHRCHTQNGVAMVGLATTEEMIPPRQFEDPELTEEEKTRLSHFEPIAENDVLEAHRFFQDLGSDWMKFIPEEMRQSQTDSDTESPDA